LLPFLAIYILQLVFFIPKLDMVTILYGIGVVFSIQLVVLWYFTLGLLRLIANFVKPLKSRTTFSTIMLKIQQQKTN